jgi:hypothetical protein
MHLDITLNLPCEHHVIADIPVQYNKLDQVCYPSEPGESVVANLALRGDSLDPIRGPHLETLCRFKNSLLVDRTPCLFTLL